MLDQLVESKSNLESNRKRGGYLFTTAVLVFSLFASGILWSLFAKNLEMNGDGLEFSSLVAPVPMPDDDAPPPEPVKQIKQDTNIKVESALTIRQVNMAQVDEPYVPKDISTKPNSTKARPDGKFEIGQTDVDPSGSPKSTRIVDGDPTGQPLVLKPKTDDKPEIEEPPPTIAAKKVEPVKVEKPKQPTTIRASVVLNGKATSLPKPSYPPAAIAVRASGDVSVQVTIDEKGNVISASAISGHALLKQVSEQAARNAKFSPTFLNDQAVKVTGLIVYKFAPR